MNHEELKARVAEIEQDRDEWKDSTIAANANAASEEKRRRAMQDERDNLRQQLAEAMKDAERYRYIRAIGGESWTVLETKKRATNEAYDAATDAAMGGQQ